MNLIKLQRNEITEHLVYKKLSEITKDKKNKKILEHISKDELRSMLIGFINDTKKIKNFYERLIKKYYLVGAYNRLILGKPYPSPICVALNDHLRILPNADVPICLYNSNIVGNLLKQSFREIWFGKEIEEYRQKVKNCPICWAGCEIIPNAIYTGDIAKSFFC